MSKHIQNLQLSFSNIRNGSLHTQQSKPKQHDFNYWKLFVRLPRTYSFSRKKKEDKQEEFDEKKEKLIVISGFKNMDSNDQSPQKIYNMRNNMLKRYISDEDIHQIDKFVQNSQNKHQLVASMSKAEGFYKGRLILTDQNPKTEACESKERVVFSRNNMIKSKYTFNRQIVKQKINSLKDGSKLKLPELKQQKKYPLLLRDPEQLKYIKSQSYIIVEYPSQKIVVSHRQHIALQIASLTKIMTFYTVLQVALQRGIKLEEEEIVVSQEVHNMTGTSADIVEGEIYTVQQMLYGLMLPSGNDAANQLSYWAGSQLGSIDDYKSRRKLFVMEMNKYAVKLGMKNSKFANSHGLPHQNARSTAYDLTKLCCACLSIPLFREIVGTKQFKAKIICKQNKTRIVEWQNTNKLLRRQGFFGLKTGITVTAGPCLASAYSFKGKQYISILLRAPKVSGRFKQTRLLLHWALSKLYPSLSEPDRIILANLRKHDSELDSDNSQDQRQFKYDRSNMIQFNKRCNILNDEL